MHKLVPLTSLRNGEKGIVNMIDGGQGVMQRLQAMGVREGKEVKKISGMFLFGPVTVQVGQTRIAIGHGMASKIMVAKK
ncbi:ferrous iron transport protein A [Candidatus Margulisiibacteriota bacterium]